MYCCPFYVTEYSNNSTILGKPFYRPNFPFNTAIVLLFQSLWNQFENVNIPQHWLTIMPVFLSAFVKNKRSMLQKQQISHMLSYLQIIINSYSDSPSILSFYSLLTTWLSSYTCVKFVINFGVRLDLFKINEKNLWTQLWH